MTAARRVGQRAAGGAAADLAGQEREHHRADDDPDHDGQRPRQHDALATEPHHGQDDQQPQADHGEERVAPHRPPRLADGDEDGVVDDEHRPPGRRRHEQHHADPERPAPRGRVPDVGQQEHVDQRDHRAERHDQHQGGPDRLAGEPARGRDPAQGADADVELADPGDEDEGRDDLGGLPHLGRVEEPRREDPAEQACERAEPRADRERQTVVQPVGPPSTRGLGGRRPYLHCADLTASIVTARPPRAAAGTGRSRR